MGAEGRGLGSRAGAGLSAPGEPPPLWGRNSIPWCGPRQEWSWREPCRGAEAGASWRLQVGSGVRTPRLPRVPSPNAFWAGRAAGWGERQGRRCPDLPGPAAPSAGHVARHRRAPTPGPACLLPMLGRREEEGEEGGGGRRRGEEEGREGQQASARRAGVRGSTSDRCVTSGLVPTLSELHPNPGW